MSQAKDESQRDKHCSSADQGRQNSGYDRTEDEQQRDYGKRESQRLSAAQVILADRLNILVKYRSTADARFQVRHRMQATLEVRQEFWRSVRVGGENDINISGVPIQRYLTRIIREADNAGDLRHMLHARQRLLRLSHKLRIIGVVMLAGIDDLHDVCVQVQLILQQC